MASNIAKLIEEELATLVAEGQALGSTPMVAVKDQSVLTDPGPTYLLAANVVPLAGDQALVLRTRFGTSLWVDAASDAYRSHYERYAAAYRQLPISLVGSGLDVDHLYNRARALLYGYRYIRVFPVAAAVNRQHGRTYEKSMGVAEAARSGRKPMKLLDEMSFLKVMGVAALRKGEAPGDAHRDYAKWASGLFGISEAQVLDGLRNLRARADG